MKWVKPDEIGNTKLFDIMPPPLLRSNSEMLRKLLTPYTVIGPGGQMKSAQTRRARPPDVHLLPR
jgi:hypothetical protein